MIYGRKERQGIMLNALPGSYEQPVGGKRLSTVVFCIYYTRNTFYFQSCFSMCPYIYYTAYRSILLQNDFCETTYRREMHEP